MLRCDPSCKGDGEVFPIMRYAQQANLCGLLKGSINIIDVKIETQDIKLIYEEIYNMEYVQWNESR